eukprot:4112199-Pleurochrysis_carterae.AAC.1
MFASSRAPAIHVLRRVVASRKVRDGVAQLPLVRAAHVAEAATCGHLRALAAARLGALDARSLDAFQSAQHLHGKHA